MTAKLVLDEMFAPAVATELRGRGHDVVAVAADPDLRGMTDADLMAWALANDRRVVTENVKDYGRPRQHAEGKTAAVLFTSSRTFRRSRNAPGRLIAALDVWLHAARTAPRPEEDWLVPAE